jgi:hypothetical protein
MLRYLISSYTQTYISSRIFEKKAVRKKNVTTICDELIGQYITKNRFSMYFSIITKYNSFNYDLFVYMAEKAQVSSKEWCLVVLEANRSTILIENICIALYLSNTIKVN